MIQYLYLVGLVVWDNWWHVSFYAVVVVVIAVIMDILYVWRHVIHLVHTNYFVPPLLSKRKILTPPPISIISIIAS